MEKNLSREFNELASGAGKQTLIKTSLRSLVDFVAITDKKINILLSINTIIISVIVSISGSQLFLNRGKLEELLFIAIPIFILLITCLISTLLAIMAASPKQIQKQDDEHLGIFMLARKYSDLDTYLKQMATVLKSNELIYKNMVTDIHSVSSFLVRKNGFLRKAYLVFFTGILLSVFSFILIGLYSV